ncbi:hypothetical protein CORC01_10715 [Colletotrichum orchidophilum]|uniref:Nucleic acid-binding protein n=1 Tax=Colletotrichum orchidophilum TaxID=1209926 RepID=A0A1G4AY67_9PEZI|nr:uncharacterized protein CORC01_10715 [Colletotrichum orchidophilum]OHE94023.1 hypothetical protein CORC01_10715 [Colletotrichum orchidophilum]
MRMMPAFSIQAFYQREVSTTPNNALRDSMMQPPDDGFTQAEVESGQNPLGRPWNPSGEYSEVHIGHIQPGPNRICFTGRIVNYVPAFLVSKVTYSRPAHQLIVVDGTGAIAVKLVPIGIPVSLLVIGQLVTIWATWAGITGGSNHLRIPYVTMYTPINPTEVGTKQFIQFLPDTAENQRLCRTPIECDRDQQEPKPLPGLMTLCQYLKTGHDISGARIIVCVKSVGSRRRIITRDLAREAELIEVTVWDDTASCVLTLWDDKADSAKFWKPNETILLFTSPKFVSPRDSKPTPTNAGISLSYNTLVDVDPDFQDAKWLRQWVKNRVKKDTVCVPFPKDIWNAKEAVYGPVRALFTLAEVDDFARADPASDFTGKLNLAILGTDLLGHSRRKMLCCTECCGVPLYANQTSATCKNCLKERSLVLNPRIMGILADETGCVAQGKLVWSDQAWSELFFPAVESSDMANLEPEAAGDAKIFFPSTCPVASWTELTLKDPSGLRILEEQMLYARLTLTFG